MSKLDGVAEYKLIVMLDSIGLHNSVDAIDEVLTNLGLRQVWSQSCLLLNYRIKFVFYRMLTPPITKLLHQKRPFFTLLHHMLEEEQELFKAPSAFCL